MTALSMEKGFLEKGKRMSRPVANQTFKPIRAFQFKDNEDPEVLSLTNRYARQVCLEPKAAVRQLILQNFRQRCQTTVPAES